MMALLVALVSAVVGAAYFAYLNATPFPPDAARLVPFLWLATAALGISLGIAALRARQSSFLGVGAILTGIASGAFAAIFSLAAVMGD
jgi:hypothetical protein